GGKASTRRPLQPRASPYSIYAHGVKPPDTNRPLSALKTHTSSESLFWPWGCGRIGRPMQGGWREQGSLVGPSEAEFAQHLQGRRNMAKATTFRKTNFLEWCQRKFGRPLPRTWQNLFKIEEH